MHFIRAGGHRLEYRWIQPRAAPAARESPVLVFLHEGLGSVALWKRFPDAVADATGCSALVYSRYGYGKSDPLTEPRTVDYMHREALEVLPELLDALSIRNPILIGHSDGASIALIYAGAGKRDVRGVVGDGAARVRGGCLHRQHRGGQGRFRDHRSAGQARPLPRRCRHCVPRLERHLAASGLPRLEHRVLPRRASAARCC